MSFHRCGNNLPLTVIRNDDFMIYGEVKRNNKVVVQIIVKPPMQFTTECCVIL